MLRRVLLVAGVLIVAIASVVVGVGSAGAAPEAAGPRVLAVSMRGTAKNTSTDPRRQVYELDLYSLRTGEKIGTATDDLSCRAAGLPGCPLFDAITTFHLPDGDIVNHATVSLSPDPARPGWLLNGAFPADGEKTIVGGTGIYDGVAGRARMSGASNVAGFPMELTGDDLFVLELDR